MKERKFRKIERKYNIRRNQSLTEIKEIIKQQMQAKADLIKDASFTGKTKPLATYLEKSDDPLNQHEESRKSYSIKKYADKFKKKLNVNEITRKNNKSVTKLAKRVKQHAKSQALHNIKQKGESKAMHGQYPWRIKKGTNNWLKGTGLKAETEGLIIAAQDQRLATRLHRHKIIKDETSPLSRHALPIM